MHRNFVCQYALPAPPMGCISALHKINVYKRTAVSVIVRNVIPTNRSVLISVFFILLYRYRASTLSQAKIAMSDRLLSVPQMNDSYGPSGTPLFNPDWYATTHQSRSGVATDVQQSPFDVVPETNIGYGSPEPFWANTNVAADTRSISSHRCTTLLLKIGRFTGMDRWSGQSPFSGVAYPLLVQPALTQGVGQSGSKRKRLDQRRTPPPPLMHRSERKSMLTPLAYEESPSSQLSRGCKIGSTVITVQENMPFLSDEILQSIHEKVGTELSRRRNADCTCGPYSSHPSDSDTTEN